jgi:hypothetical protein
MTEIKNIDDILVPREQAMVKNEQIPPQPADVTLEQPQEPALEANSEENVQKEPEKAPETDNKVETESEIEATAPEGSEIEQKVSESPIDEYGNPVEKPRMYTEEEVNQRIRERLSRGRYAEQPTQQQVEQVADNFKADPNSEESWETQLEAFVEKTIDKKQKKAQQEQWQRMEKEKQADFEAKFTTGMNKYPDFIDVVKGKPITTDIMLATRSLDNPAAFIYGASKLHPQELDRISKIPDAYQQAMEVGRLHEKMVKARHHQSKAAKPIEAPKGDVPVNAPTRTSIDSLIEQHGRQKQQQRNPGRR